MYDLLQESPIYQDWIKQAREEGRQEGLETLRETLLTIVQARFPSARLRRLAKGQTALINDPAILQDLIVKVSLAQTIEEVQQHLLDWPSTDDE